MSAPRDRKVVELFYDVISPYSWIGFEVLCRYRSKWNIDLKLKPFLLGGIMHASGNQPPATLPMKGMYMMKDIQRLRDYYQIPIVPPADFAGTILTGGGSLSAQRLLTAIDMSCPEYLESVSRELWYRVWSRDEDIKEHPSLKEAMRNAGLSDTVMNELLSKISNQTVKDRLRQYTQEAVEYGAFGAPIIVAHVDGKPEMFFGSDRFLLLAKTLGEEWCGPLVENSKCKL